MKLMSFAAPLLVISLIAIAVCGIGMMAVRASAVATQSSIDLLRMNLRVARLHQELLQHNRDGLAAELKTLRPTADGSTTPETGE